MTAATRTRDWTLRRRLAQTFGIVGVIIALLAGAVIVSAVLFARAGNEVVYRWQPAIIKSGEVLNDLVDQETGLRGYALLGKRKFLEPYTVYLVEQRRDSSDLRKLVGDDDELRAKAARLEQAIDSWRNGIAVPAIKALDNGDNTTATSYVARDDAKARFDAIRARAAEFATVVQNRTADARHLRTLYGTFFFVGAGIALLVLLVSGLMVRRGFDRWVLAPMDSLALQTRQVASGSRHQEIVPSGPHELTALAGDVEDMRLQIASELDRVERVRAELQRRSDELARSNEDLQQFAYVASHDLSEPLRKVANFCQLIERQYGPQLDDRARQYIAFAVDGAKRMQALITDLLALSRVGRSTESFEPVDLDGRLDQALSNLSLRIEDSDATIERLARLPTVEGDRSLLVSLFENLLGNAIKYRRPDIAPIVRVGAEPGPDPGWWTFTISDNGIGIAPEYAERIFAVFQRLHLRDEYGGTGIGLALCRKIVDFHDGRIWLAAVESGDTATGATFRFTLPEVQRAQSRD